MLYQQLLDKLNAERDEEYAKFHSKLLNDEKVHVIGVRMPVLRKIAKQYEGRFEELKALPDDYYEVTFIKLTVASLLPYDKFTAVVGDCVKLIDNWACCDCFKAKCIKKNRQDFIKYIKLFLSENKEFYQRYALTSLLNFYVEEEYLDLIFQSAGAANTDFYYVHMAVAWLIAEVLVKHYQAGVEFLKRGTLDKRTHNKAITKATESYRLSEENKKYLKSLKR